ncbi:hypothetical protein [Pseudobutyrivibrio sp.]
MMTAEYSIHHLGKTVTFYDSDGNQQESMLMSVHVASETVLNNIPVKIADTIPPGSLAYLTGMGTVWQKGFDGEWEEVEL